MLVTEVLRVLAVLAATVAAQDDETSTETTAKPTATTSMSSGSSTTTSTSAGPATVTIAVGADGHVFTPHEAAANVGDIIKFNFYPGGHRVARAEFGWPCIPYEYANVNKAGFYTGIFSPQVVSNNPPSYSVRVNDTEPIFFYCAAPGSCIDYHMIGVINPNATQTYDAQLEFAKKASYQLAPGEPFPTETPAPRPTPGSGSPQPDPSSTSTSTGSGSGGGGGGLSAGAIAGIAIGAAAVLILAAALIYLCGRRGGFDKAYRKSGLVAAAPAPGPSPSPSPGLGVADPAMAEAAGGGGAAYLHHPYQHQPKSPGQVTLSSFAGHDGASTLRSSFHGGGAALPGYGLTAGHGHGYGYGHGGDGPYPSPHTSPRPDQFPGFVPPPVELPTGDAPEPARSPPPGYPLDGQYRPGGKP